MRDPAPNLAGRASPDQHLWNTYVFWARNSFDEPFHALAIAEPSERLPTEHAQALQAIVFTTFALEYRLRSVYESLNLNVRRRDGVWTLLENLEGRLAGLKGFTGKDITFADEWKGVQVRLKALIELRNKIAHAKRGPVSSLLLESPSIQERAQTAYNAFIDAIRIINVALAYDERTGRELVEYYERLQVRPNGV